MCYRIEVPADWSQPDGATVSLPVAVLPATGTARQPDAIVVPAGGPGFDGLGDAEHYSTSPLRAARDIVLYDQRGTGRAEPSLECPERDAAWEANLQRDAPFAVERAAIVDGLTACRRRLEAAGVDLGDYDTEASVRDLDQIRAALGYDRWNLLGISYGARLSLAAMRSTPEHLRSVILDSVYDVTGGGLAAQAASAERAFRQLADGCAADPTCHAAHPDVAATIDAVRERYNATPIQVDVDLGRGAGPQHWVITGDDAMAGLFNALYDASLIPALPTILDGLAAGDTAIVPALIRARRQLRDRGRGRDADVGRLRRQRGAGRGGRRGGHRRPGPDPPDRDQRALLRVAGAGDLVDLQRARGVARAHLGAGRGVRPDHPAGRHPGGRRRGCPTPRSGCGPTVAMG